MTSPPKIRTLLLASLIIPISACTTNPYTGQEEISKTAIGTGIGAVTGALIGNAIPGNRGHNAAIGAALGAATGAGVGYYMDRQESELRQQLQNTGVSVTRHGNNIILNMPGNITFPLNQYTIQPRFYSVLNSIIKVVKHYNQTYIRIAGYTDDTGTYQYNMRLSQQRARSVASYLVAQGVNPNRVQTIGYGENNPIATNSTAAGRAMNRRVTMTLIPIH